MIDFTFGTFNSATVPELEVINVIRDLRGEARDEIVWIPGRATPLVFPQPPGKRTIKLTCHVLGDDYTDRRAAMTDIADGLDQNEPPYDLTIDDEPTATWKAVLVDTPTPDEWVAAAQFDLTFLIWTPTSGSGDGS